MTAPGTVPDLSLDEQRSLLALAREAIDAAVANRSPPQPDLQSLSPALTRPAACFVTLHSQGALRGCTGTLVAELPLALDVRRCAIQTATNDPRFDPIQPGEMDTLEIEISVLTQPQALQIDDPAALSELIRPDVDGVTLYHGSRRATFLPQVWERIHDPVEFLDMLCRKMGLSTGAWRLPGMAAEVYQTFSFSEADFE